MTIVIPAKPLTGLSLYAGVQEYREKVDLEELVLLCGYADPETGAPDEERFRQALSEAAKAHLRWIGV